MKTIREYVQELADAGIHQEVIAAEAGVHQTTISRILNGQHGDTRSEVAMRIMAFHGREIKNGKRRKKAAT